MQTHKQPRGAEPVATETRQAVDAADRAEASQHSRSHNAQRGVRVDITA